MSKACCPLYKFKHFLCNDPDRCTGCGEAINSWVSGGYRCKCEMPKMPRDLINDDDDRPAPIVRYGN